MYVGFTAQSVFSNRCMQAQSGAAFGFVNKLVALTMDPRKERREVLGFDCQIFGLTLHFAGDGSGSKGKRPLLRPIICICNDL